MAFPENIQGGSLRLASQALPVESPSSSPVRTSPNLRVIEGGKSGSALKASNAPKLGRILGFIGRGVSIVGSMSISIASDVESIYAISPEGLAGDLLISSWGGERSVAIQQVVDGEVVYSEMGFKANSDTVGDTKVSGVSLSSDSPLAKFTGNLITLLDNGSTQSYAGFTVSSEREASLITGALAFGANPVTIQTELNTLTSAISFDFNIKNAAHKALAVEAAQVWRKENKSGSNRITIQIQGSEVSESKFTVENSRGGFQISNSSVGSSSIPSLVVHGQLLQAQAGLKSKSNKSIAKVLAPTFLRAHDHVKRAAGTTRHTREKSFTPRNFRGGQLRIDIEFRNAIPPPTPDIGR